MSRKKLLLLAALFTSPTWAADLDGLTSGVTEAINISAKHAEIENIEGVATYTGNVVVTMGEREMKCDKLIFYRGKESDIGRIVAYGNPVGYSGKVKDKPDIIYAYSDVMEYNMETQMFYMRGNARVEQGKNSYEAPEIQYDVQNEIITSSPSSEGRVRMVIDAESLQGS